MVESFGQQALLHIFVHIFFLGVTWWALQAFKFDLFVKNPNGAKAKTLMILLTIAIAYLVSSFLLEYFSWSTMLRHLF
ncbi:DUF1146 family protein [Bacillus alkalicellulosilyticus]|uniref:DUF1146 family protein n=1 Tax=Alkalihalobacterium alkalicellulosilyticum TaxID=1912214 RepID=UPI0009982C50|nr:DUF1146 family protein [Bacillus alkalicellulosilyticus]